MCFFKKNFFNLLILILGIVLACTPTIFAPVCPVMQDGFKMSCYYSKFFVLYLGILISILSFILIFVDKKIIKIILNLINIVAALLVHLVPQQIVKISVGLNKMGKPRFMGYCMKSTMNCVKNHTFLKTSILGIVIAVLSIVYIVYLLIKKED